MKALIQHASLAPPPTTGGEHFSAELNVFNRETIKQGIAQGYQAFSVSVVLRPNTILKSVRVFTVFQALEQVATVIQSNPPIQDLDDESLIVNLSWRSSQGIGPHIRTSGRHPRDREC